MTTFMLLTLLGVLPPNRPATPSPRHFWASAKTQATPGAVWDVWTAVDRWHEFDTGLSSAKLTEAAQDELALGVRGELVSEGRTSRFEITEYTKGKSYTLTTQLPLGKLHVHRVLTPNADGSVQLTHEVWFTGLGGRLLSRLFGPKFRAQLPEVVASVAHLAEAQSL